MKLVNRLFSVSDKWARNILWLAFRYPHFKRLCFSEFNIVNIQTNNWFRWHSGARCFVGQVKDSKDMVFIKSDSIPWRLKNEHFMANLFHKISPDNSAQVKYFHLADSCNVIVFELCAWQTLEDIMKIQRSISFWRDFSISLVEIIDSLNSIDMIHRDITPSNILINVDNNGNLKNIKLIDFAYALTLSDNSIDSNMDIETLSNLGQGLTPRPMEWDDAYSSLSMMKNIENLTNKDFSQFLSDFEKKVGRLTWRFASK